MIYKCLVICCKCKPYFFYRATLHSNILTADLAIDFEEAAEHVSTKVHEARLQMEIVFLCGIVFQQ